MKGGIFFGVLIFGFLASVFGLDESAVYEQGCKTDLPNVSLNLAKFVTVTRLFFPAWSTLESYRIYSDILNKEVKDLTEADIKDSCINSDRQFNLHAFNETRVDKVKVKFTNAATSDVHFTGQKDHGLLGKYHVVKTDNESYVLGLTCWEDNQLTWDVISTKQKMDPGVKTEVYEYLKTLGFKMEEKFIAENNYDNCKF